MNRILELTFLLTLAFCIPYQAFTQTFGYTTWDNSRYFSDDYMLYFQIETGPTDGGDFTHVGFYQSDATAGADLIKMGIYEDNGSGSPANKLVETLPYSVTLNSYNQIELDSPIDFDPSTIYWVVIQCNVNTGFGEFASGDVPLKYRSLNYGSAWPDPAGTVSGYTENGVNIFAIGNGQVVLPVELLEFQVKKKDETSNLMWKTATEINNEGWNIQRSQNGFTWTTIDWVDGSENSYAILNYSYQDTKPLKGINFYRLEQMDFDGKKSYSEIRSMQFITNHISISPNPATDYINIQGLEESSEYKVLNAEGKLINSHKIRPGESIEIDHLMTGQYFLDIGDNIYKFMKL